jgi:hypothetical protein
MNSTIVEFVTRTTARSDVPERVADPVALDRIAALSAPHPKPDNKKVPIVFETPTGTALNGHGNERSAA